MSSKKTEWKLMKNVWIAPEPVLPGVWQRKEGGHVVRARAKDSATGKMKEVFKVLSTATAAEALAWLEKEQERLRVGVVSPESPKTRFSEFADALLEHKVKVGDIKSASGRAKWDYTLLHLIGGTDGEKAKKHVEGFGDFFIDRIRVDHVEAWKAGELVRSGPTAGKGQTTKAPAAKRKAGKTAAAKKAVKKAVKQAGAAAKSAKKAVARK